TGKFRLPLPHKLRFLVSQDELAIPSPRRWNDNWSPIRNTSRSKQPSVFRDRSPSCNSRCETCRTTDSTAEGTVSTNEYPPCFLPHSRINSSHNRISPGRRILLSREA